MIPRNLIYKHLFVFLYKLANEKVLLYIAILYIFIIFYFQVNDSHIIYFFILTLFLLFIQTYFINKDLKKQFDRYKKYLRLKRIRKFKKQ